MKKDSTQSRKGAEIQRKWLYLRMLFWASQFLRLCIGVCEDQRRYGCISLLFSLLLLPGALMAEFPELLTFHWLASLPPSTIQQISEGEIPAELRQVEGHHIRIRGFLYSLEDGGMVLAADPDLKSCCIGSSSLVHRQIAMPGFTDKGIERGRAVLVEGEFIVAKSKNGEGKLRQLFALEKAAVIVEGSDGQIWYLVCGIAACITAVFSSRRLWVNQ